MRKELLLAVVVGFFLAVTCCSQEKKEEVRVLAKINDFELSLDTFQQQLKEEVELAPDFKITQSAREQFLEELIRKELLVQEAKKRQLDRREKFVRAIERYWEATLIRDLMEEKGAEIAKRTLIGEEEVQDSYAKLKASEPSLSANPKVQERIRRELLEEKKNKALEEWVRGLRRGAKIEINQRLLQGN